MTSEEREEEIVCFDVDSFRTNGVCDRLKNDLLSDILVLIPETSERYLIWQKKGMGRSQR